MASNDKKAKQRAAESTVGLSMGSIQSQSPDVVVLVGSGDSAQEFNCYKVTLASESTYIDVMLSSSMKEGASSQITFPDKNPEEWKLFYEFISPQRYTAIDSSNVLTLLPWFHEFQMDNYVEECDNFLANKFFKGKESGYRMDHGSFWTKEKAPVENHCVFQARMTERKEQFDMLLQVLQFSLRYDLLSAKRVTEKKIADLMTMALQTEDLFDFRAVKSLISAVLPLELDGESGLRMKNEDQSKHLWPLFKEIITPHISTLSQQILDDEVYFPHIVYCHTQIKMEQERSQAQKLRAQQLYKELYKAGEDVLYSLSFSLSADKQKRHKERFATFGVYL